MEFKDNRSRRIVFMGNCMLNQNARFPGIALKKGSLTDIVEILSENGIGIEQMPCLECMGWGGVNRKTYYKFQPIILYFVDKKIFPFFEIFFNAWLFYFKVICNKEADKVVKRIRDYIKSGYEITGIIASNDSPTCGVTRTIDMLDSAKKSKELGFVKGLEKPDITEMRSIIPALCTEGSGLFMKPLMSKLKKKNINIKIVGFDPWAESHKDEALKVATALGLN